MDVGIPEIVRQRLREAADPTRAPGQQVYMKSNMPFLGVRVPQVRRIARMAANGLNCPDDVRAAARTLWDEATHREERYAGIGLLGLLQVRGDLANAPLVEHMVRTGRWWDFTDDLAHVVAAMLDANPVEAAVIVGRWSADDDLWLRRLAILAQLQRGVRTDVGLLVDVIQRNLSDKEFFIRKAIGWALRDYARTAPNWVRAYVESHELSPLSRREAVKHL